MIRRPRPATIIGSACFIALLANVRAWSSSPRRLDHGFGSDGLLKETFNGVVQFPTNVDEIVSLSDGGFLALTAGVLVRFRANGERDPSFPPSNIATMMVANIGCGNSLVGGSCVPNRIRVAVAPGDRIVVGASLAHFFCASVNCGSVPPTRPGIVRLLPDGSLDRTFGTNGVIAGLGSGEVTIAALATDSQNRTVVSACGLGLIRLTSAGDRDGTFADSGVAGLSCPDQILVQPDGKILTKAFTDAGTTLRRYDDDGRVDVGFGQAGAVDVELGDRQGPEPSALLPEGRILVNGKSG